MTVAGDVQASDVSSPINSQQQPCIDSTFSYTINKSIAATYEILFTQSNPATNVTSDSTKIRWIFDNVAPLSADILQPNGRSARSSDNVFFISGICDASGSLLFDGAETTTVDCQDGVFSRSFNSTTDGVFTWNIRQQDLAGNLSPSTIVIWTRDSTAPATPSISSPHNNSYYAASTVVVSGSCTSGMKVFVGGNASAGEVVSPYGMLEQLCVENSYSFTIQKQSDASYDFSILQRDAVTNVASTAALVRWTRDTSAPALPIVTQPTQARVRNAENTITIAGTCETDALVNFSGSSSTELICTSGTFSYTYPSLVDGNFSWTIRQTDRAGNTSNSTTIQWSRDTIAPESPVITSPSNNQYSSASTVIIAGSCHTGHLVKLEGAVVAAEVVEPSNSLVQVCSGAAFQFTVTKNADNTYDFSLKQTDVETSLSSAATSVRWNRDSTAPDPVEILQPAGRYARNSADAITISGRCETSASVVVTGASTTTINCNAGAFSFTRNATSDGTYDWSIKQRDFAQNTSSSVSVQWVRDTSIPIVPSILTPLTNTYSTASAVTIAGGVHHGICRHTCWCGYSR